MGQIQRKCQKNRPKLKTITNIYIIMLNIEYPNTPINGRNCQIGAKRKARLYATY